MKKIEEDIEIIEKVARTKETILTQLRKTIVGQQEVIEQILIGLFARGHCIIVGVPGLAKTMIVNHISQILDLEFNRIQFTPDLMPSDITGTDIIEEDSYGKRRFKFIKGPIFTNILLADEINRTPPKTQSALLQAMQEYKVTVSGNTYPLPLPFYVLATQNPIEQEGTYPLPEAQLDRFLFFITIDYPSREEEKEIVRRTPSIMETKLEKVITAEEVLKLQEIVKKVPVSEYVIDYAVRLVESTRPTSSSSPSFVKEYVSWGAGPRATQSLILGAKARAILNGRTCVSVEDIKALAIPVLRHRIILNFNAEASGVNVTTIISQLLDFIKPDEIS